MHLWDSRFGRSRGGGIRQTSLSHVFQSPIPIRLRDNKHTKAFTDFFASRKEQKQSRHKLNISFQSLRKTPYTPPTTSSQNNLLVTKPIMPSPVSSTVHPSQDSKQSTLSPWTNVPKRKSSSLPSATVTPNVTHSKRNENSFAIFTDDEEENILTDMSPIDVSSEDNATTPRSIQKKKKKEEEIPQKTSQVQKQGSPSFRYLYGFG